ncbi:hypothetical protein ACFLU6_08660 [Acidobacteriota bacterium]
MTARRNRSKKRGKGRVGSSPGKKKGGGKPNVSPLEREQESRSPQKKEVPYSGLQDPWWIHGVAVVLLMATTCILYWGDLGLGFFNLDDKTYVVNNPWIKDLNAQNIFHILSTPYFANFSPMHLLSYMLDFSLAGENPAAFHLSSNLWAGIVSGLLYLVIFMIVRNRIAAIAASLLFVVHPAHVEAVAWISSRKDLVAAAFALPAILAYLYYRRRIRRARLWYVISVVLFALSIAGKLSVVVVPAILLVFDLLIEKRRGWSMILDKIPYGLIVILFVLPTMGAQPETRHSHDLYTIGYSLIQNLVLLSGFGEYVLERPRPEIHGPIAIQVLIALVPFAVLIVPLALRRWVSTAAIALFYWIVLALAPPLVLSFVHPVTDRYLFFPSAGLAALMAWGFATIVRRYGQKGLIAMLCLWSMVGLLWTLNTLEYLSEWKDPRSVWYGATQKSRDVMVYHSLGSHYQDAADSLHKDLEAGGEAAQSARRLAGTVWSDDARLETLLEAWDRGEVGTPETNAYQADLKGLAMEQFDLAVRVKGTRVVPNLFFRRGKLVYERGDLTRAEEEFRQAFKQARQHTSERVRRELTVRCHYALGLVEWQRKDYEKAHHWISMAEKEQQRYRGNWVPGIEKHRQKLERIMGRAKR